MIERFTENLEAETGTTSISVTRSVKHLPNTFFNLRLSPVELADTPVEEIHTIITKLVAESANPELTGVCCINMADKVTDEKIDAIFETVERLRILHG